MGGKEQLLCLVLLLVSWICLPNFLNRLFWWRHCQVVKNESRAQAQFMEVTTSSHNLFPGKYVLMGDSALYFLYSLSDLLCWLRSLFASGSWSPFIESWLSFALWMLHSHGRFLGPLWRQSQGTKNAYRWSCHFLLRSTLGFLTLTGENPSFFLNTGSGWPF